MSIVRAFQIEKNYQKHRTKLREISSTNSRKKVSYSTNSTLNKINSYNKKKSISLFFRDYERDLEVMNQNKLLHRSLTKTYGKDPGPLILDNIISQSNLSFYRSQSKSSARSSD